jgi:hypothetical protein
MFPYHLYSPVFGLSRIFWSHSLKEPHLGGQYDILFKHELLDRMKAKEKPTPHTRTSASEHLRRWIVNASATWGGIVQDPTGRKFDE